jgi:hypothetical protein
MAEDDPTLGEVVDSLQELVDAMPEEVIEAHKRRLEFTPDHGIYDDARLKTPDCVALKLSSAYYWATDIRGRHLVDVPHSELPDRPLTECSLRIRTDAGVPLLSGQIVDVGRKDGLGGNTTVVVAPGGERDG